ncbi:unnamed protein product, partial [Symbiodinium necroappetens]
FRWTSEAGWYRALNMLKDRYDEQYDGSTMTWGWWRDNIKGAGSAVDVTCNECGYRCKSSSLKHLRNGSDRYDEQCDASRMTWCWWRDNIKGVESAMDVTCNECGHRSKSTSLNSLQMGRDRYDEQYDASLASSFCYFLSQRDPSVDLSTCWSELEFFSPDQDRYDEQYDASRMTWGWWRDNIKGRESAMDVTCNECGRRCKSSSTNRFQQGQAPGCLCNKKTEAKLRRWLCAKYPDCTITSQVRGCTNPDTQRPLLFDFGLYQDTILIELDGDIGHFGRG